MCDIDFTPVLEKIVEHDPELAKAVYQAAYPMLRNKHYRLGFLRYVKMVSDAIGLLFITNSGSPTDNVIISFKINRKMLIEIEKMARALRLSRSALIRLALLLMLLSFKRIELEEEGDGDDVQKTDSTS